MKELTKPHYTRAEVAALLNISVSRVSQVAKSMSISLVWKPHWGFTYSKRDLKLMMERNTKPGPKNGAKK